MISREFKAATKPKRPAPFSLRLSPDERAFLKQKANGKPISAYIRAQVFGSDATPRKLHQRRPAVDKAELGKVLGKLGQSRLSSNLNQIAKAANIGALPVDDALQEELRQACEDIAAMRQTLIKALGIKPV